MSEFWFGYAAGAATVIALVGVVVALGIWLLGGDDEETP